MPEYRTSGPVLGVDFYSSLNQGSCTHAAGFGGEKSDQQREPNLRMAERLLLLVDGDGVGCGYRCAPRAPVVFANPDCFSGHDRRWQRQDQNFDEGCAGRTWAPAPSTARVSLAARQNVASIVRLHCLSRLLRLGQYELGSPVVVSCPAKATTWAIYMHGGDPARCARYNSCAYLYSRACMQQRERLASMLSRWRGKWGDAPSIIHIAQVVWARIGRVWITRNRHASYKRAVHGTLECGVQTTRCSAHQMRSHTHWQSVRPTEGLSNHHCYMYRARIEQCTVLCSAKQQ